MSCAHFSRLRLPGRALLLVLAAALPAWAADWVGAAQAVEGDVLQVRSTRLRLFGIDAPEPGQHCQGPDGGSYDCAAEAVKELARLIDGETVRCRSMGRDPDDMPLAVCMAGATDLNAEMVRAGWAVTYLSRDYQRRENEARAERRGLWQGRFDRPEAWRRKHKGDDRG